MTGETAEKNENKENSKRGGGKRKAKQFKVGITENGIKLLNQYMEEVNKTSRRKINVPEVLEFAVQKLSEKDVRKIQERAYTPDDKMEIMLEKYNQRNPEKPLSRDEIKAAMVEAFEKQVLSKLPKANRIESNEELKFEL